MNTGIDCQTMSRLLSDAHERDIDPDDRVRLTLHLGICEACRNVRQHLSVLHRAMKLMDEGPPEPSK